jgi:hypothetical protein
MRPSALLVALFAVLGACSLVPGATPSPRDLALRALAEHQAQWTARNVDDYTFTITRQCFCPMTDPIEVTVVDGVATQLTSNGQPVAVRDAQGIPKTIAEVFSVVAGAADAAALTVEWDPAFGFPTSIQVDSIQNAVDDEFGYLVTDFHPAS